MKSIIKGRWAIGAVWLLATILLTLFQPDINAILRLKGQASLSSTSDSVIADELLKKMEVKKGTSDIIVFYNKDRITQQQMKEIQEGIQNISNGKTELGIFDIIDPFSMPEAKSSLLSKDKTTLMVSFKLDRKSREIDDVGKALDEKLKGVSTEYYFSGTDFINNDYLKTAQSGIERSAALTVIFILVVLIIMFRSVVTPLISLLAIGVTYMCSMGITAQLIDKADFPLTSLTQMLLILILFGIGTDYNILLFNRFKEELAKGFSIDDSIMNTYRTAGKTIAFSILTVFIAFLGLIFAESPTYKSGVVVVIGVSILLLEILTLTPLIMKILGNKLFWPSKGTGGHKTSKFWGGASTIATKHPIISVVVVLLIILPTVYFHEQKLNFNTVGELGDSQPSSRAFNLIGEKFGEGQAMPLTVVIDSNKALDNNGNMSVLDGVVERLKKVDGVEKVSSVTQPEGKRIEDLYVSSQMEAVTGGIEKTQGGVDKIKDGLTLASDKLGSADFSQVSKMVEGTGKLETGLGALTSGLEKLQNGIGKSGDSGKSIQTGLDAIRVNLVKMNQGLAVLSTNYTKMQQGYKQMGAGYQSMASALLSIKGAVTQMNQMMTALGKSYPGANTDPNYLRLKGTLDALVKSLAQITPENVASLNKNYDSLTSGFGKANAGLSKINSGLSQLADGLKQVESGLSKASNGMTTIITNMDKVTSGIGKLKAGQEKLVAGLNGFGAFGTGLSKVSGGLGKISDGLGKTNGFLTQLNKNKSFFIPKEALTSKDFKKVLDAFMSDNRKITKITVILSSDPYSDKAMDTVELVKDSVAAGLKGTELSDAKYGVSGPSAMTNDMNRMLGSDLNRMTIIVLIGVLLVLIIVMGSVWEPVVITGSLLGAYFAAMYVLNFIFIDIIGYEGISSFVPFFSFIIIVALGVDYSIFLMMRFKEYTHLTKVEAIVEASKNIGGVVMSAAVILGGTFATLMPSGLVLLAELSVGVIIGLSVLCFVMLPLFLPAMIRIPKYFKRKNTSFAKHSGQPRE